MCKKLILVSVMLAAGFGCSRNPNQFALDAVEVKPEFDPSQKTWAMAFSETDNSIFMEQLRMYFNEPGRRSDRPQEGAIMVCWENKNTHVTQITSFDPATKAEQSTIPTLFPECR